MASTVLFVVMVIIAGILLLIASLSASIGAVDVFSSSYYNTDNKVRSAHQYLTVAAALGWSSLVVLIVILVVATVAGGFTNVEISDALLNTMTPTRSDLLAAYRGEKELMAGHTTQIIILIVLIILVIITFAVGILSAIAAAKLDETPQKDTNINKAYTESLISAISGIGGIGILMIAIITYVGIRSSRQKKIILLNQFEQRAQAQIQLEATTDLT